jgi:hypothetical protein
MIAEREGRLDRQLQDQLANKQIDANKYLQKKELAQRESEFSRNIALQKIIADRDHAVQQAQLELQRNAEARAERSFQAELAANPARWIEYEFYKRGLGNPQAMGQAQQIMQQGQNGAGNVSLQQPYSDETIQKTGAALQNPEGPEYNPNLAGTGAFGIQVQSPNTLSRNEATNLSDTEMAMLASVLKAGININGNQVALDPGDYFQQVEGSWIPTLSQTTPLTQYR